MRIARIFIFLAAVIGGFYLLLEGDETCPGDFTDIKSAASLPQSTGQYPGSWFFAQRAYPYQSIPQADYLAAIEKLQNKQAWERTAASGSWEAIGPTNIGGRISSIVFHPTDTSIFYVGAASGGVFKTTNGLSFTPIFDEQASLSIGDLAMDPTDPETIYVGTGEANAGGGSLTYEGAGVFRTSDGGDNWTHLGLESSGTIGKIIVDPIDPNRIFVAAVGNLFRNNSERGIYRTEDGGSTWEQVLFLNDSTGGIDLAINSRSPDTIYAAMWERVRRPERRNYGGPSCGVYRSTDGGDNWTKLTGGLPTGADVGRIGLGISQSDPEVIYAQYADAIGFFDAVYKSTDGGDNWTAAGGGPITSNYSSFGWWFGKIFVDPTNPNKLYSLGLSVFRSNNGGSGWSNIGGIVHVDQHAVAIHPAHPSIVLLGNDGGVYRSTNSGNDWTKIDGLPITQFYTLELDPSLLSRRFGGTQDNGTVRTLTGGTSDWTQISGGDGMVVKVDPSDPSVVYTSFQNGGLMRSDNGGASFFSAITGFDFTDRFNWKTPYLINPQNPSSLLAGTQRVYRSGNQANNWVPISADLTAGSGGGNLTYGTLTSLAMAPTDTLIIYTGADDGSVHRSQDGGVSWDPISSGLPQRWITSLAVDATDPLVAYITFSGFRNGEDIGHVYKTTDGGDNWDDISGDLPDLPANHILPDPFDPQRLFLATDGGVFTSDDAGLSWLPLDNALPVVVVNQLAYDSVDNYLIAATYGRSMFRFDLEELPEPPSGLDNSTFEQVVSLEVFPNPGSDYFNFSMRNQSTDWLGSSASYTIEIYDLNGKLLVELNGQSWWDGRDRNGQTLPNGTYLAYCRFADQPAQIGGYSTKLHIQH